MLSTPRVRRLHRLLGIVIGLQVLLWTASGIYFAWTDIDEIRGDHLKARPEPVLFDGDWVAPSEIDFTSVSTAPPHALRSLEIVAISGEPYYRLEVENGEDEVRLILASAKSGIVRGPIQREEAVSMARASFTPEAEILDATLLTVEDVGPHHEYRGRPLPAWRVRVAHESWTHIYISANEAEVATHRNRGWRIFDTLWMVHTMDFFGRDDFNNPLLRGFSVLALAMTLSGYLMWFRTRPRRGPKSR
jgi:hypothetical protein